MPDAHIRSIGIVDDIDGIPLDIGVDYDTVTICDRRLNRQQLEELGQLLVAATWEAARCGIETELEARDA